MGNEINNFVKMFLAGMKMLDDQDLNKAKGDYYKALAAKAGKNTDKKDDADLAYTKSQTDRNNALTANTGKAAPMNELQAASAEAIRKKTKRDDTPPMTDEQVNAWAARFRRPTAPAPAVTPPSAIPVVPPAAAPAVPGPQSALEPPKEEGEAGALPQDPTANPVVAAVGGDDPYKVPDEELDETKQGEAVVYSAMGGAIPTLSAPAAPAVAPEQEAPEAGGASIGEIVGAGLHNIQDTYGLHQDNAALPGTDPARQDRLKAFHRNDAAMPPEELDAVIKSVDPNGTEPDHNGLALNMLYNFYAKKGDTATAAKAAGSFLGAARQRSMEYGQDAVNALQKRDAQGASKALVAAYNEVPDGNEVTAQVNQQGVGKAVVNDVATGKVVHELPINPQVLAAVAQKFATGDEFYTQLAQIAAPGLKSKPALRAVVGGPVFRLNSDGVPGDEEPDYEGDDDEVESGDEATVQDAGYDEPDGGGKGSAPQGAIPAKGAQYSKAPDLIPYHPAMTADQKRYIDKLNQRDEADWRVDQSHELQKQRNSDVVDREAMRREQGAIRDHERVIRQAADKAKHEDDSLHNTRMANDKKYAADFKLREIDRQQAAIPRNVPGRSETAQAAMEERYGDDTDRQMLQEKRLDTRADSATQRTKFSEDYDTRIEPYSKAMEKVIEAGRAEAKSGKIDTTLLPNITDERKERMLQVGDRIAAMNDISPKEIAEVVYGATQNTAPGSSPKILRDGSMQVGAQNIILDRKTFHRLAALRGERQKEFDAAISVVEARKQKAEEGVISTKASNRERVDEQDQRAKALESAVDAGTAPASARTAVEGGRGITAHINRWQDIDSRRKQMLGVE